MPYEAKKQTTHDDNPWGNLKGKHCQMYLPKVLKLVKLVLNH